MCEWGPNPAAAAALLLLLLAVVALKKKEGRVPGEHAKARVVL